jgi:hypothetical protein
MSSNRQAAGSNVRTNRLLATSLVGFLGPLLFLFQRTADGFLVLSSIPEDDPLANQAGCGVGGLPGEPILPRDFVLAGDDPG